MKSETHELTLLAGDLELSAKEIGSKVARVTGKAMGNIKRGAQRRVRGHSHIPHLARSFTYDVTQKATEVVGEVGAEHERLQGKLDVYIEFPTVNSAGIPHWAPEAEKEIPVWLEYLDRVAAEAIEKPGA